MGEAVGCQTAYYAFDSEDWGGVVRVIVLDDSSDVDAVQLRWLEGQLADAKASATPAIVFGNADLGAQIKAGDTAAGRRRPGCRRRRRLGVLLRLP